MKKYAKVLFVFAGLVGLGIVEYSIINKSKKAYAHLYSQTLSEALIFADKNKDNFTSLEEEIEMYEEIGYSLEKRMQIGHNNTIHQAFFINYFDPSLNDLRDYIKKHKK